MTEDEYDDETPDERMERIIKKYQDPKYNDIGGIDFHSLYCYTCEEVFGIDYDYGSRNYPPAVVCSNKNCKAYLGGYYFKDNDQKKLILSKLRTLGAKERVSRLETGEVFEDWH